MERTQLLKPRTLADLIRILHELFSGDEVNVEEVQAVLEAYESNPAEWALYAKFDQYSLQHSDTTPHLRSRLWHSTTGPLCHLARSSSPPSSLLRLTADDRRALQKITLPTIKKSGVVGDTTPSQSSVTNPGTL